VNFSESEIFAFGNLLDWIELSLTPHPTQYKSFRRKVLEQDWLDSGNQRSTWEAVKWNFPSYYFFS